MRMIYKKVKDFNKWEKFILNHPGGYIFQSPGIYNFYNSVSNHNPFVIAVQSGDEILGLLSGVIISNGKGIERYFSRRAVVWGGPLIIENVESEIKNEIVRKLIKEFDRIVNKKAIYTEFRNLFELSEYKDIFEKEGYQYEEHLNYIIDLTLSEEQLWKNLNQKRRNEIYKAIKENLSFKETSDENSLKKTYKIIEEVYSKAKLPFPELVYFKEALKILTPDHFKIFSALYDGEIIGTMYTLCYNNVIYDWYAGSYKEYYSKCPNDLIPWEVFKWGKLNGFRKFDFGGAGKPGVPYGVRDYKKKFGGKMVNYGRYKRINNKFLYKIGEIGVKYYGILKK